MKQYVLLAVIGFMSYSFANDAQRVKLIRDQSNLDFKKRVEAMINCDKEIRSLSEQVLQVKNDLINSDCKNIQQMSQFKQCIKDKETSLKKMKTLLQNIASASIYCEDFQTWAFTGPLNLSIKSLDRDLVQLKGHYEWTIKQNQSIKNANQITFNDLRYFSCSLDIGRKYRDMLGVQLSINLSHTMNNLNQVYTLKKEVKELQVLNDYIKTKAQLCLSYIPPVHLNKGRR